jgi:tetratricopeptide (TPR) repeat protein
MDVTQNNTEQQHDSTQHYEVLMELGDCHTSVGDYHEAQQCYEKAAVLCPDEAGPYVGLGVVALQKNLIDDALTAFKVACRLDNKSAKAYAGLGMVAQQCRDYKRAFDMFLKSLEMDTNNMISLLGLFQTSCQMGSFEKVTYYLETYLNMHPGDVSVMYPLAALYMKDGKLEDSRKVLLDILTLDRNHKDAANLLEEVEHNIAQVRQAEISAL